MTRVRLPVIQGSGEKRNKNELQRRDFMLLVVGWVGTLGSMIAASTAAVRGLVPNLLDEPSQRYRAAKPDQYLDGVSNFIEEIRVFIQRKGNGYRAVSAVCTHLGCTVNQDSKGSGNFRCPCHGSVFAEDGTVLEGPAPEPLPTYSVSTARDGRLIIDRGQKVPSDRFLVLETPRIESSEGETA